MFVLYGVLGEQRVKGRSLFLILTVNNFHKEYSITQPSVFLRSALPQVLNEAAQPPTATPALTRRSVTELDCLHLDFAPHNTVLGLVVFVAQEHPPLIAFLDSLYLAHDHVQVVCELPVTDLLVFFGHVFYALGGQHDRFELDLSVVHPSFELPLQLFEVGVPFANFTGRRALDQKRVEGGRTVVYDHLRDR